MQTLEDLKQIGFHTNNFINPILPSFFYNSRLKRIIEKEHDLELSHPDDLIPVVLKTVKLFDNLGENMELELFRQIYNAKLVAWLPMDQPPKIDDKQVVLFRFAILEP